MPGTAPGTQFFSIRTVFSATSSTPARLRALLAGDRHVRLEHDAFERDALAVELLELRLEHRGGDLVAAVDVVVAVHQHLGLDDRHDLRRLAERGVARERMRVGVDRGVAVGMPAPMSITARHFAKRAPCS